MKKLTEDLIAANKARLKAVGTLVRETRATLAGFGADRSKMATDQAKDLAGFVGALSKSVEEIRRGAQDKLGEFDTANRQMSRDQSRHLADYVQGLVRDVTFLLRRFDKERAHMSRELGERLDGEIADIKTAVEQILKDAAGFVNEQHAGMVQARQAWQDMCAAISEARKVGFTAPAVEVGPAARLSKPAGPKRHGRKVAAKKSS
ncbi:MAG: hypothetical protein A2Y76_13400 [Planctomycetes bacterium RBG_13_60_9]|nr:MAG: hypothetical protein A2Y76_13400 [Planctomycetes bacterium RBG_13_60_9]